MTQLADAIDTRVDVPDESRREAWVGMYPQERMGELYAEIERQRRSKRDYVYPASQLAVDDAGQLVLLATETFRVGDRVYTEWADAEAAADAASDGGDRRIEPLRGRGAVSMTPTAERQLANRLGIPLTFVRRLRSAGHADLAGHNFRTLLERDKRRFLLRCMDGRARAVLSDSYRILDNHDLFFCAAETFQSVNADLWKSRLWDDGFELFAVAPHIRGEVTLDRTFDPGDGWLSRWRAEGPDVLNAAVRISNSETGEGGLKVQPAILRRVCANFCVWGHELSAVHVGRRVAAEGLLSQELGLGEQPDNGASRALFGEEVRESESRTIWLKVRDAIRGAFNPEAFATYVNRLNLATGDVINRSVERAVDNVVKAYDLSDQRRNAILSRLLATGDRTRYGLIDAVTYAAHDADRGRCVEDASRLEELGGTLAAMEQERFAALVG